MDALAAIQNQFGLFLVILARVSGIFIISPFFGSRMAPTKVRVCIALAMTVVLFPALAAKTNATLPEGLFSYAFVMITELIIGWIIGFVGYLAFAAVNVAGQIMDMQVGFAMVTVLNPSTGEQVPLIGTFEYNLAVLVFLITNGHHIFLKALFDSFEMVPIMEIAVQTNLLQFSIDMVTMTFSVGLKLALPVLSAILLLDVALGVLARTMPQMNIFIVGIPAKLLVGMFVLAFAIPFYILFLDVLFNEMYGNIYAALRLLV
jgi:flagellar biosynthetic protein FliR